jgi:ribosomal-protein-alanine N-acetyltransferase
MRIDDVPEVTALEALLFRDAWSADSFLAEVERRPEIGHPFVVRADGDLIAYGVVWFIVDELHVGNVAVHPDHQGRGLGRRLMGYVLREGRRRGMASAMLEVRPSNTRARALYESLGFRQVGVRRNYYRDDREDALVLELDLDPSPEERS